MIKKVALFNDLSGFGKCSLAAALPVLSALGIQCHPIPTMVLSGQCGYAASFRKDMTEILPHYINAWTTNQATFDGIYTGFSTNLEQIKQILEFIKHFRKENTFLLVDPVMGDNGRPYKVFSEELLSGMKELSQQANLITPNLTEACLLCDVSFEDINSITEKKQLLDEVSSIAHRLKARATHEQDVVITGIKIQEENNWNIYNLALTSQGLSLFSVPLFDKSFSGTGDLLSSTLCGLIMNGYTTEASLKIANDFVYNSVSDAITFDIDENEGVLFEKHLKELIIHAK
jgi:pyridoxine kinase